jgi:CheY-like chemotaxis protein
MPEIDGFEFIEQLRSEGRSIRAINFSADAREEERQAALTAGFQAYLTKPIEIAEPIKTIQIAAPN